MSVADIRKTLEAKMTQSIESFRHNLGKIRAGRASPGMLDSLHVEYYGSMVPIAQVCTVTLLDQRTISVQPFERGMGAKIEKAIRESDLGLNPSSMGDLIRVPVPSMSEERRRDLTKLVRNEAESAKVVIRNQRRDGNDAVKKLVKDKAATEDDQKKSETDIQKTTDRFINDVDRLAADKEKEIMSV
jgi:ribosome recycling factor